MSDMYPHPDGFIGGWWTFDKVHGATAADLAANYGLNSTAAGSAAAPTHIAGVHGGAIRCAMAGDDGDARSLATPLYFRPDRGGPMIMEARVRVSDGDDSAFFVGFNDATDDAVAAQNEDGALNTTGTDLVGIIYEGERSDANGDRWVAVSTKNGNDVESNITLPRLANSEWVRVRVEVNEKGDAQFFINQQFVLERKGAVDADETFCGFVDFDDRDTAYNGDVNWIFACQPRA